MLKKILLTATAMAFAATVFAAGAGGADQSKGSAVTIPAPRTAPVSGKQMYASYCAPCHGVNGKGDGPVSAALKANPTDLTVLSRNNNGQVSGRTRHGRSSIWSGGSVARQLGNAGMGTSPW